MTFFWKKSTLGIDFTQVGLCTFHNEWLISHTNPDEKRNLNIFFVKLSIYNYCVSLAAFFLSLSLYFFVLICRGKINLVWRIKGKNVSFLLIFFQFYFFTRFFYSQPKKQLLSMVSSSMLSVNWRTWALWEVSRATRIASKHAISVDRITWLVKLKLTKLQK